MHMMLSAAASKTDEKYAGAHQASKAPEAIIIATTILEAHHCLILPKTKADEKRLEGY